MEQEDDGVGEACEVGRADERRTGNVVAARGGGGGGSDGAGGAAAAAGCWHARGPSCALLLLASGHQHVPVSGIVRRPGPTATTPFHSLPPPPIAHTYTHKHAHTRACTHTHTHLAHFDQVLEHVLWAGLPGLDVQAANRHHQVPARNNTSTTTHPNNAGMGFRRSGHAMPCRAGAAAAATQKARPGQAGPGQAAWHARLTRQATDGSPRPAPRPRVHWVGS